MDLRYQLMRERLSRLSMEQIWNIVLNIDSVLFDNYNYCDGKMCPMGVALNLKTTSDADTNAAIAAAGFVPTNILKGVPGAFYHGTDAQRKLDLLALCKQILDSKNMLYDVQSGQPG